MRASQYPRLPLKITRFILPDEDGLYFEPGPNELPAGWASIPPDRASMAYGTKWLRNGQYFGLIVPSAVLPLERNIMLNPDHAAIARVSVDAQFDFMYDERMFLERK